MKVLSFMLGADTAGIGYSLSQLSTALPEDSSVQVRSLVSRDNYIKYPEDLEWDNDTAIDHWKQADLIHTHHGFASVDRFMRRRDRDRKRVPLRPFLIHFHGTGFRERPRAYLQQLKARNASAVVSTLDLQLISGLPWLPHPIDIDRMRGMRRQGAPDVIKIAHAPTDRTIKSTTEFILAISRLRSEGYPIQLELIEQTTWSECLRRKADADIFFDQVKLGYGVNALESWAMGMPVIAGASEPVIRRMQEAIGYLPFYPSSEGNIYQALRDLCDSKALRERYAHIGRRYVETHHSFPVVHEQLLPIYEDAVNVHLTQGRTYHHDRQASLQLPAGA